MEIGLISPERVVSPFLRFVGTDHPGSEVCGAVFDPSGTRLYLTSQRAFPATPPPPGGIPPPPAGAVYEVSGPFRLPAGGVPRKPFPAGEQRPRGPLNPGSGRGDGAGLELELHVRRRVRRAPVLARGLPLQVRSSSPARVSIMLETPNLKRVRAEDRRGSDRPRTIRLARLPGVALRAGRSRRLRLRLGRRARVRLLRRPKALEARVIATAIDGAGNRTSVVETVRLGARRTRT